MLALLCATLLAFSSGTIAQREPVIHQVDVGKGTHSFEPNTTYASIGDIITFNFYPTNHSVVRAEYGLPCIPWELSHPDSEGFASPNFITQRLTDPPQWNLTVNDTKPVFYYCTAIDSCTVWGMIGVINPNASVSVQDQYDEALKAPYMLVPGQPFPAEGADTVPHMTPNASLLTATPTGLASATAAAASTSSASNSGGGGSHLGGGAIAGIVVAAVAFIGLLAGFFWLLGHRRGMLGSSAAGQSMLGKKGNQDRTEAWAAASSNGPWSGNSDAGAAKTEMAQPDRTMSPQPSPGFLAGGFNGTHGHTPQPSNSTAYFPPQQQQQQQQMHHQSYSGPAEMAANEVTELEAPHVLKQ